ENRIYDVDTSWRNRGDGAETIVDGAVPFAIDNRFGPIEARILLALQEAYEAAPLLYKSNWNETGLTEGRLLDKVWPDETGHNVLDEKGVASPNPHKTTRRSLRKRLTVRIAKLNDKLLREDGKLRIRSVRLTDTDTMYYLDGITHPIVLSHCPS